MGSEQNDQADRKRFYDYEAVKELKSPEETNDAPAGVREMERALENLRVRHLPFRFVSPDDMRELEELRLDIVKEVTSDRDLDGYYREAWLGDSRSDVGNYRYVAVRQLHLMERAFYVLQLQFFANSPQNAGWMNLFRRWGNSPHFNAVFDELARTLTQEFCRFYHLYLRNLPHSLSDRCAELSEDESGKKSRTEPTPEDEEAEAAIHHPWLERKPHQRGQGLFMDSGIVEASVPAGSGGIADESGRREGHETPSDRGHPPGRDENK